MRTGSGGAWLGGGLDTSRLAKARHHLAPRALSSPSGGNREVNPLGREAWSWGGEVRKVFREGENGGGEDVMKRAEEGSSERNWTSPEGKLKEGENEQEGRGGIFLGKNRRSGRDRHRFGKWEEEIKMGGKKGSRFLAGGERERLQGTTAEGSQTTVLIRDLFGKGGEKLRASGNGGGKL